MPAPMLFISKPLFKSKMLHALQLFCDSCKTENHAAADEKQYADLLGKRILLVEDNMLNREIAVDLLQLYGLIVEEAENGQVAVDSFSRSEPGYYDFILMMSRCRSWTATRRRWRSVAWNVLTPLRYLFWH